MAFSNMCYGCGGRARSSDVLAEGNRWHIDCLVCQLCKASQTTLVKENGQYFCVNCFEQTFLPKCLVSYFLHVDPLK